MPCPGGSAEAETSRLPLLLLSLVLPLVSAKLATAALLLDRYRFLPTHTQAMAPKQGSVEVSDPVPRPLHPMTASSPPPHPGQRLALLTGHGGRPILTTTHSPSFNSQVGPPAQPGQGRARRSFVSPDELVTSPQPGSISVLAHILDHAVDEFADVQALGWRDTIDVIKEDKDVKKVRPPRPPPPRPRRALTPLSTVPLLPRSFACTLPHVHSPKTGRP